MSEDTNARASARAERLWKLVDRLFQRTGRHDVFERCCDAWLGCLERHQPGGEQRYMRAIEGLDRPAVDLMVEGFAELMLHFHYDGCYADLLGPVYMLVRGEWGRSRLGQYFTPWPICVLMAQMVMHDSAQQLARQGYVTLNDPCCGSGAMLLAGKSVLAAEYGREAAQAVRCSGQDIDALCVTMATIQLLLVDDQFMQLWARANAGLFQQAALAEKG